MLVTPISKRTALTPSTKPCSFTRRFKTNGANAQYETLQFHPQGEWLLTGVGGGSKTLLHFFDLAQKRLVKEIPSFMPTFGLAVSAGVDALYTVGRGQVIQWKSPA